MKKRTDRMRFKHVLNTYFKDESWFEITYYQDGKLVSSSIVKQIKKPKFDSHLLVIKMKVNEIFFYIGDNFKLQNYSQIQDKSSNNLNDIVRKFTYSNDLEGLTIRRLDKEELNFK